MGAMVVAGHDWGQPPKIARARAFELVDEKSRVLAYWGIDASQNVVLSFGSYWPDRPLTELAPGSERLRSGRSQRIAIGVIGDSPYLRLTGADGLTRARLLLNDYGKPVLLLDDETGPRVLLGVEQSDTPGPGDSDWSLAFLPDLARIGMYTEKIDGRTYAIGSFGVRRDRVPYPPGQPRK